MASASKPRQPRLRASCDGCFLAKVKCSKARPICSRCLACGIECRYSPSSRAGKPKSDHTNAGNNSQGHLQHGSPVPNMAVGPLPVVSGLSPMTDKGMLYSSAPMPGVGPGLYGLEAGWQTPCSMDSSGAMSRNHSISSELGLLGMEDAVSHGQHGQQNQHGHVSSLTGSNGELYTNCLPWTPPTDLSMAQFPEAALGMHLSGHGRSHSCDFSVPTTPATGVPWLDSSMVDIFAYGHNPNNPMHTPVSIDSASNNYFPSPATTPSLRQSPSSGPEPGVDGRYRHRSRSDCTCFATCLGALQSLHNASSPTAPAFDVVLTLNRGAVDACAAMLGCQRCMSRSGTQTAAMLLATVIGKITSFYRNASQAYFDPNSDSVAAMYSMAGASGAVGEADGHPTSPQSAAAAAATALATGLGVSMGAYQLQGEDGRWLQLQILHRELRKLEEVYSRFRQVCGDLSEDAEMSKAMIGYLGQTLGSTLDMVNHRQGGLRYA